MIKEVTAVAARQNLGEWLNLVQHRNDAVLITKDGKAVAALVDAALFERIRRMREEFIRLTDALGQAYAGVDEAEAIAEIDAAVRAVRRRRSAGSSPTGPGSRSRKPA